LLGFSKHINWFGFVFSLGQPEQPEARQRSLDLLAIHRLAFRHRQRPHAQPLQTVYNADGNGFNVTSTLVWRHGAIVIDAGFTRADALPHRRQCAGRR
jgi:hypothetical protein